MSDLTELIVNYGHPWDGRDGFDLLTISRCTNSELEQTINEYLKEYWHIWISSELDAVLYKPSNITSCWTDSLNKPYIKLNENNHVKN